MKFNLDTNFFKNCFSEIINVPSPVGYYVKLNPIIEKYAAMFGEKVSYDNKSTAYITLEGEDNSKTVIVGAHADTLGLVVRKVEADGKIRVRQLGGVNYATLEGETATVHTRDGLEISGLIACQSHSVHVFDDARTLERNENTIVLLLDEKVKSKEEVYSLGIRNGDFISIDPRCSFTENGFIKSRFIDDKAGIACCFSALKYLKETNQKIESVAEAVGYESVEHFNRLFKKEYGITPNQFRSQK